LLLAEDNLHNRESDDRAICVYLKLCKCTMAQWLYK
jgi:hypothetical protein